ncbi:MAG: arabinan endo-1,5-alpha-L-arabinosidase [bacterium]|nr:arabinan endo-1,5-alpha-L-arabinosidase [bacterium]
MVRTAALAVVALALLTCEDGPPFIADLEEPGPGCTGNIVDLESQVAPIHDPAIAKLGDTYYVYSSSPLASFYTSPDLVTWTEAGQIFDELPPWVIEELPNPDHIGAPDIAFYRGVWILFYQSHIGGTCNAGIGLATNVTLDPSDPRYQWVDHGLILRSTPLFENFDFICGVDDVLYNAIDPHLFIDDDETPWLVFGSTLGGLLLAEIDSETLRPTQHPRDFVVLAARPLLQADPIIEAPYIIRRGDYYYLFLSHNSCCKGAETKYKILVGRSEALEGPYVDREGVPLIAEGGTVLIERDGRLIGTGHADVYSENGIDWLVHHAYDSEFDYEPVLNIRRLVWGEAGWPEACNADGTSPDSPEEPSATD